MLMDVQKGSISYSRGCRSPRLNQQPTGISRQFITSKEDGINLVLPRSYIMEGKTVSQKLTLVSINEKIGQLILNDCHTHSSNKILRTMGNISS